MNKEIPKINIMYGRFLDPIFIGYIQSNSKWENWTPPAKEEVLTRIKNYKNEWSLFETKILQSLCDILNMEFKQNIIDVYIVSGNPRQFSNPIVIKSGFHPDEFVDVLTHELIHKLMTQNTDKAPVSILSEMFPKEKSQIIKNHIITHAVLKYIYLDILKDESRLKRNINKSKKHSTNGYVYSWEIVEKEGYKEIIEKFKNKYKNTVS